LELNKEHIDDLIAKYLAGEALPDEAILLDEWRSMSPENELYFTQSEKAFQFNHTTITKTDTARLYQDVLSQMEQYEKKEAKIIPLKRHFTPLRIAASLLVISFLSAVIHFTLRKNGLAEITIASADTTQQQQLADGSTVFLNKHTKLIVEGGFNGKKRKLKLEGEAFFEVVHDDKKPFVIEAGGIQIKDIGTAFNVKAQPESDSVIVSVSEGIVDITNGEHTVQLMADQSLIYIRSTNTFGKTTNVSVNSASYKTRIFKFKATTLEDVIATVNEVYGPIMILENKKLAKCNITVEFENQSPQTIVDIVTETLGLTYDNRNGQYVIKGTSCNQ
jgi:transmembrane sensor